MGNVPRFQMELFTPSNFFMATFLFQPLSLTEEEIQAVIAELAGKCKAQEGVSDADVQDAIAHKPPASRQAQCFHACMMENFGAVWIFCFLIFFIK